MIPNIAHFVFGLEDQREPFHFARFLSIESCRRIIAPEKIFFHYKHLPWGPWWDRVEPHLSLIQVELANEVLEADYSSGRVPMPYRYAHHADFIRLDALIEHGGIYADIDTIFLRPIPGDFFEAPFVIGAEKPVPDGRTGEIRPSLCNAILMSEPDASFARAWREQMADELNDTWSNHSGFLAQSLSRAMSDSVRVEPEETFFAFRADPDGVSQLLTERHDVPSGAVSVHMWAHLWWQRNRRDFTVAHAGWCTPWAIRRADTTFAELARPYLPENTASESPQSWEYFSLDEGSGYGIAADRCMSALEDSGLIVNWTPMVPGGKWRLGYDPAEEFGPPEGSRQWTPDHVVVSHTVPEYYPLVRERCGDAFLVGHTAWETDRLPEHWIPCIGYADLVVVPSRFCASVISGSPASTPVEVVPHVAPQARSYPSPTWDDLHDGLFVYYTIAVCNERKALFKTIEAYLRAFQADDPVRLIVKTSYKDYRTIRQPSGLRSVEPGTTAWALARMLAKYRDPPALSLVTRELSDDELVGLHHRGDCFVSLSRGEGWGLGAFDATAYGNPVITTRWGGQLDYLGDYPYLVDFDLVPVQDPVGFPSYVADQKWAEPDLDHAAATLRRVFEGREDAAAIGSAAGRDVRRRYRPEVIADAFRSAVGLHRGGTVGPA